MQGNSPETKKIAAHRIIRGRSPARGGDGGGGSDLGGDGPAPLGEGGDSPEEGARGGEGAAASGGEGAMGAGEGEAARGSGGGGRGGAGPANLLAMPDTKRNLERNRVREVARTYGNVGPGKQLVKVK